MTEEEKKAIETLKSWKDYNIRNKNKLLEANKIIKVQETILSLIEKLQKENEELHKEIDRMKSLDIYKLVEDLETGQLIPIQKIKDKIKELEEKMKYEDNKIILVQLFKQREVLKELLEGRK